MTRLFLDTLCSATLTHFLPQVLSQGPGSHDSFSATLWKQPEKHHIPKLLYPLSYEYVGREGKKKGCVVRGNIKSCVVATFVTPEFPIFTSPRNDSVGQQE